MARSTCLLAFLVLAGCSLGETPPPYRRDASPFATVHELEEPGGIIAITAPQPPTVACPRCGAMNKLGLTHCEKCQERLGPAPHWVQCETCLGKGKLPDGSTCSACKGRGWIEPTKE